MINIKNISYNMHKTTILWTEASFLKKNLENQEKRANFALVKEKQGSMSEWLGTGLQNRSHQFESGWHLPKKIASDCVVNGAIFFFCT